MIETWVWLTLSLIGLAVSGYLTRESVLDLRALPPSTNGRRYLAWSRLSREFLRTTVHIVYILAALGALRILPVFLPFIVPFLMYGNLVLVANSVIDARSRRHLFETRKDETVIQQEDREVGDIRRALQRKHKTGPKD